MCLTDGVIIVLPSIIYVGETELLSGGRTAWAVRVTVNGHTYESAHWRTGDQMAWAREDAAEMALRGITGQPLGTTYSYPTQ